MNMREKMARAMFLVGARQMNSKKTWETCEQAYRDLMFGEADAAIESMDIVNHAFLDAARDGLPMESGLAARFWKNAMKAIKEGK